MPPDYDNTLLESVFVLGAGNFGTCLSQQLARNGHRVVLWDRSQQVVDSINHSRKNIKYQSEFELHPNIEAVSKLDDVVFSRLKTVVICLPTQALREVLSKLPRLGLENCTFICASKGIEMSSGLLPLGVIESVLGRSVSDNTAVLSGPSFAVEIMQDLPTAVSCAAVNDSASVKTQSLFHSPHFRVYTSEDPVGLEIAGAMKNVIAIAAGAAAGLGFQSNTRAALITRGLAEITRLGAKFGVSPSVFSGLGGVGDLMLTCTSDKSRNYMVGYKMGRGMTFEQTMESMKSVAEGVYTVKAAKKITDDRQVDAPITNAVYKVIYENVGVKDAVAELLNRDPKSEIEH